MVLIYPHYFQSKLDDYRLSGIMHQQRSACLWEVGGTLDYKEV